MTKQDAMYLVVTVALGLVALSAVGGGIYLAAIGQSIPESVVALGSAAVGALSSLMVPAPTKPA